MNVKPSFTDLQRAECRAMIAAHHAGDAHAYEASAAEALRLLDAQVADRLAAQSAPEIEVQDGPVRPGYAAGIAAYAEAQNPDQRDRRFDELCLIRADEIISEKGDPDPEANFFEIYDIDGDVRKIISDASKIEVTA